MTIGERIKNRRKALKMNADDVAEKLGVSRSTVFRYEKGDIEKFPTQLLNQIADVLHTTPGYLMGWEKSDNESITSIYSKLKPPRQQNVYNYAKDQLEQQNHPNVYSIEEAKEEHTVDVVGVVSAGTGEWLDGQDSEVVTIEGPIPRYDFAVRVNGNSMEPTFSNGEILFVNKVDEARNNQFVIAEVNGEAFVKKLFVSMDGVKLISLNRDYDDIVIHDYDDYQIVGVVVL